MSSKLLCGLVIPCMLAGSPGANGFAVASKKEAFTTLTTAPDVGGGFEQEIFPKSEENIDHPPLDTALVRLLYDGLGAPGSYEMLEKKLGLSRNDAECIITHLQHAVQDNNFLLVQTDASGRTRELSDPAGELIMQLREFHNTKGGEYRTYTFFLGHTSLPFSLFASNSTRREGYPLSGYAYSYGDGVKDLPGRLVVYAEKVCMKM